MSFYARHEVVGWSRVTTPHIVTLNALWKLWSSAPVVTLCPWKTLVRLKNHRNIYLTIYAWVFLVVSFPQVSPPNPVCISSLVHTCYMPRPSDSSRFYYTNNTG